jgi:hypothetical protein
MLSYNFFGVLFNTTKLGKRNLESKEVGEKFFGDDISVNAKLSS